MIWRSYLRVLIVAGFALISVGCDYSDKAALPPRNIRNPVLPRSNIPTATPRATGPATVKTILSPDSPEQKEKREAILSNVLRLIETAGITPGGNHFEIATDNLNQYFEQGTKPGDFAISPASRQYFSSIGIDEKILREFESANFTIRDARHLEDCMLYQEIATRIAGEGDDLTRVRRVFDWITRQVQLVPPQSLAPAGLQQAQARPYDVLLRGMATETGYWSERGWLFMALCRQLGIDVGLVTYTPAIAPPLLSAQPDAPEKAQTIAWICAALIDDKAYLFDARIGLAIPDASGRGVATLDDALADPEILDRLNLPNQSSYGTSGSDLRNSSTSIGILTDSSTGYLSPRMRLLQTRLTGKNRTILFRDPADQRDHFVKVLGSRIGAVQLWDMPAQVERLLFSNPQFVEATQQSLALFNQNLPLLYARMAQLKGQTSEAMQQYVACRFVERGLMRDKRTPILPQVQVALDIYSTYFLGQCHLDQGNAKDAEFFFGETLRLVPEPGGGRPSFFMFRWGAETNLGLLCQARGETSRAIAYFGHGQPTFQGHGNLLRARDLVWIDPLSPPCSPLPPAPLGTAPPGATTMR